MRFQTPQFIEVEDKIFGPLTLKQFIYVVGGVGLAFIAYQFLPFIIAIFIIIPVLAFSFALAFYKINNKPFISLLESAFNYFKNNRLYIWKKRERTPEASDLPTSLSPSYVPRLSESKLKDMSWSLGVKDSIYAEEIEKERGELPGNNLES